MNKIFVDLDGVLTDFDKQLAELLNKKLVRGWDFGNDPKVWAKIAHAGEKFWSEMAWMPDGHDLWEYIKDFKPTVLTAPTRHPSSKTGKKIWLKENLPGVPAIIDSKKEQYAKEGYILIDDREKNIKKWEEAGGTGILHKDAESSIKELKKIMEEQEKDAGLDFFKISSDAIADLQRLSEELIGYGRTVEAAQVSDVATRWEEYLQQQKLKGSPGQIHEAPKGPVPSSSARPPRSFFPENTLLNNVQRTLGMIRDQKASILRAKLQDLSQLDPDDPIAKSKSMELRTEAQSYSQDMGSLIGTLLSLRHDNKDRNKVREVETDIRRLSDKILGGGHGTMREERGTPRVEYIRKDPFSGRYAKQVKINPYDIVVQEAVQELGPELQGVDVIQLEATCPGDKLAWVTNKDLIKGRPGKEAIIHLCLKKIKDAFKQKFGKEYAPTSPDDNRKMKEMVKAFLINVVLPHEHVHIQQEMSHQGEFGPSPEMEAEKAENWKAMEQFGIRKAMAERIDHIADALESAGLIKEAYEMDIIANSIEAFMMNTDVVSESLTRALNELPIKAFSTINALRDSGVFDRLKTQRDQNLSNAADSFNRAYLTMVNGRDNLDGAYRDAKRLIRESLESYVASKNSPDNIKYGSIEKTADLERFYIGLIKSVLLGNYSRNKIKDYLNNALTTLWPFPDNVDPIKGRASAWKKALLKAIKGPSDILDIVKGLKLKSGELAEKTMPIDVWAEMARMGVPEFIRFVDTQVGSQTDLQSPSGDDGNPVVVNK